jgi:phage FluMu protein gp41
MTSRLLRGPSFSLDDPQLLAQVQSIGRKVFPQQAKDIVIKSSKDVQDLMEKVRVHDRALESYINGLSGENKIPFDLNTVALKHHS